MEERKILEILVDWNYWGNFKEEFIEREIYFDQLKGFLEGREVIVVKGVRRAGKSSIVYQFVRNLVKKGKEKDVLIVNFEDPRFPPEISSEDLNKIYEVFLKHVNPNNPKYVVLDEVQYVDKWERFVRFLSETKRIKVFVTGSSSKLMSEEYATVLTGRHFDVEVFPLSFKEFLLFKNVSWDNEIEMVKKRFLLANLLNEYLRFGGFPEVVLSENEKRKIELSRTYFSDILTKDIVKRFKIKKFTQVESLAKIYISNIATIQSFNRIKEALSLSLDSVERFSKYFEISRLFLFLNNFRYSVKEQIKSKKKVYVIDPAFYSAFGFKFSENIGRIMENVVAIELFRKKEFNPKLEIFYCKVNGSEVDFVLKEGLEIKQLIQVTYASAKDEIEKREIKGLIKASELLKCKDLLVITWDYEDELRVENKIVKFIPLWKWLLQLKS
jgi:predicted AAA+ superfamily ATPase